MKITKSWICSLSHSFGADLGIPLVDGSFHAVFPFPFVFSLGVCVGRSELQVPGAWPVPNLTCQEELVPLAFTAECKSCWIYPPLKRAVQPAVEPLEFHLLA